MHGPGPGRAYARRTVENVGRGGNVVRHFGRSTDLTVGPDRVAGRTLAVVGLFFSVGLRFFNFSSDRSSFPGGPLFAPNALGQAPLYVVGIDFFPFRAPDSLKFGNFSLFVLHRVLPIFYQVLYVYICVCVKIYKTIIMTGLCRCIGAAGR